MTVTEILERMAREYNFHSFLKALAQEKHESKILIRESAITEILSLYIESLSTTGYTFKINFRKTQEGTNYVIYERA